MQLDPRLHEAELLAWQLAGQHVAFGDAQRGALVRERSTTDRRAQSLRITPVGEQFVTQALALLLPTERELLDALPVWKISNATLLFYALILKWPSTSGRN